MSTINSNQSETPQCSGIILIIYSQSETEFLAARVSTKGLKQAQKVDCLHNTFERKEDLETQEFHLNRKQQMFLTLVSVLPKQKPPLHSIQCEVSHCSSRQRWLIFLKLSCISQLVSLIILSFRYHMQPRLALDVVILLPLQYWDQRCEILDLTNQFLDRVSVYSPGWPHIPFSSMNLSAACHPAQL